MSSGDAVFVSPGLRLQVCIITHDSSHGCWEPELSPHALPNRPSLHPSYILITKHCYYSPPWSSLKYYSLPGESNCSFHFTHRSRTPCQISLFSTTVSSLEETAVTSSFVPWQKSSMYTSQSLFYTLFLLFNNLLRKDLSTRHDFPLVERVLSSIKELFSPSVTAALSGVSRHAACCCGFRCWLLPSSVPSGTMKASSQAFGSVLAQEAVI